MHAFEKIEKNISSIYITKQIYYENISSNPSNDTSYVILILFYILLIKV